MIEAVGVAAQLGREPIQVMDSESLRVAPSKLNLNETGTPP
jgi:hypothetical protein